MERWRPGLNREDDAQTVEERAGCGWIWMGEGDAVETEPGWRLRSRAPRVPPVDEERSDVCKRRVTDMEQPPPQLHAIRP